MDYWSIIQKYYPEGSGLYNIYVSHGQSVANKAVELAKKHPELDLDIPFLYEAGMLHDIGIFMTDAPEIECFGDKPYICHGYLGSDLLRKEGFPRHALVCERHTGTGLKLENIIKDHLPVPQRDMCPQTLEEQLICFSDKFYSKTKLNKEKTVEKIREKMKRTGKNSVKQFDAWCKLFL
ncbi:MAG: HDIG domain-containing protein [Candidatus Azobacteroides sp.]|nr:HDIG domain-containing protein [Candidatus Azobacteroides sp.]